MSSNIDFAHPTSGAVLDEELIRSALYCIRSIEAGQTACMQVQLANSGGDVPVLSVRPSLRIANRPEAYVRYYNSYEGLEVSVISLPDYIQARSGPLAAICGRKRFRRMLQDLRRCGT